MRDILGLYARARGRTRVYGFCSAADKLVASYVPVQCQDSGSTGQRRNEDSLGLCHTMTSCAPAQRDRRVRQVAMLLAYQGANYHGMSLLRRSGLPSVEAALFGAMMLSGAVDDDGAGYPPCYSRVSRTDRGVSALGQVVSLRMRLWDGVVDDINCHLPDDIRVCGVRRVPPQFNAQTLCDDRLYTYTVPSFAFAPMCETVTMDYRIPESRRLEVAHLFEQYVGVHSFHSFSPGGDPESQRMTRTVLSIDVDKPYLVDGMEFVTVWIRGASFVLSQIRRMVGLVIAVCRGVASATVVPAALGHRRLSTVTAPGLGLMLRLARYDTFATAPWNVHGRLQWPPESAAAVQRLQQVLLQHIHDTEARHAVTFGFLSRLLHYRVGVPLMQVAVRSPLGYAAVKTSSTAGQLPSDRTHNR